MQTYLIKVEVRDGNHLYREFGLIEAMTYGHAEAAVNQQIKKDNDPKNNDKWWRSTDEDVEVRLKNIEPIEDDDADVLQAHGIAYFIDRK